MNCDIRLDGRYHLAPETKVLENNGAERVLVNLNNREWIKVSPEAFSLIENRSNNPFREIVEMGAREYHARPSEIFSLFEYLVASELVEDVSRKAPGKIYFNVTNRCNLACRTCYFGTTSCALPSGDPMTTTDALNVLESISPHKPDSLVISGGEPFVRGDALEIIEAAMRAARRVTVLTNATLINREVAGALAALGAKVQVSIEGPGAEIHDAIRGKGSFELAVKGIQLLLECGVSDIELVPTLTRQNIGHACDVIKFAKDLGVGYHFSLFMPVGKGQCNRLELELSPEELCHWFYEMLKRECSGVGGGGARFCSCDEGAPSVPFVLDPRESCGAGDKEVSIAPDGEVYPCPLLHYPELSIGNILREGFDEICLKMDSITISVDEKEPCSGCNVRYFCGGGCAAYSYAKRRDFKLPDPYCEFYKRVFEALVWDWVEGRNHTENWGRVLERIAVSSPHVKH
ncbi:MAG TPA: radical SAM protein [Firmicutes bacterium]|nr:radical SAM protein [Bacillota bacterium]